MRLGRPLALTAAAMLAIGIASPAAAEGSNTPFTVDEVSNVSATGSHTFTGAGCISADKPGTVLVAIGTDDKHVAPAGQAMADAEGKWSVTADMAKAIADSKGDPKTDPWAVFAQCMYYDGTRSEVLPAAFNLTPLTGKANATGEGAYTSFEVNAQGFNPNTVVTLSFVSSDKDGKVVDGATELKVGTATSDANGAVSTTVSAPANIPDGYYVLKIAAADGEYAYFESVFRASGNQFVEATNTGAEATPAPDASMAPKVNVPEQTTAKNVAKTTPKKELAKTGVEAPAIAILALGLTGVGAVALKRRQA
ncbi:hypothetical protein [Actinomyces trachealis]|uniref:hypothetical protein n=1 Tax=Actinomyces trachealis TaxID=2763540 RepID=UPI001892AF3D|nr:hypothetical protein [Actinomyces trachealis]